MSRDRLDRRTPFEVYRDARINSITQPDSHHGSKMRDLTFRELHNAAAIFKMGEEGLPNTPDNFKAMRARVAAMVAEDYAHIAKDGVSHKLGPQISTDPYYKRVGD